MGRHNFLITLSLALATAALLWGADPGRAQAEEPRKSPVVTGNFRDPESIPKKRTITRADREAAARRLAEGRAAALKKTGNTQPKETSPSQGKGGPK